MRARRLLTVGAVLVSLATTLVVTTTAAPAAALTLPFNLKWGTLGSGNGQFNSPRGVAVDATGNVFVADRTNHRIQVFSPSGAFIRTFGTQGSANGQMNAPNDVAVDAAGNVFVADTLNDRIDVFTTTGTFVRKFGTVGTGDGQFSDPMGITVGASGSVYVADTGNNRVQHLSASGTFFRKWGSTGPGDGKFQSPRDVVFDPFFADVYVADVTNQRIQRFSNLGVFETKWGTAGAGAGQFDSPRALTVDPVSHEVVVADSLNNRLQRFDQNGVFKEAVGAAGSGNGQFASPQGLVVDAFGNLFAADSMNNRIERFGAVGAPLPLVATWASGSSPRQPGLDAAGNLYVPSGLSIDKYAPDGTLLAHIPVAASADQTPTAVAVEPSSGNLYVAMPAAVRVLSPSGALIRTIGAADSLETPNGVIISPLNGDVYFTDFDAGLAREYTNGGTFVRKWAVAKVDGIGVDANGLLYVSSEADRIDRFSATGTLLGSFGTAGPGIGQFLSARGVAVDPQGDVLVIDSVNNRLQEFSFGGVLKSHQSGFSGAVGVAADSRGNVYVADTGNNRIKRFATSGQLRGTVTGGGLGGLYVVVMQVGSFGLARGAFTDGAGAYVMTVPPGRYIVGFVDPLGTHTFEWFNDKADITQVGESDFVTVPAGGGVFANAAVVANGVAPPVNGATLTGTVTGAAGGVPGAFVYAVDLNTGRSKGTQANAVGGYTITGLHPGNGYRVLFIDPTNANLAEWFDNHIQVDLANATPVSLFAGVSTPLSVTLADNPTL